MEVKHRDLENISTPGMRTTLKVSIVNGRNNDGLGGIVRFVSDNVDSIHVVSATHTLRAPSGSLGSSVT
jgi:uncharacterized radical SAM superfamily Fe-S cluster-containing enzyme